jgi:hypothetical protein
MPSSVIDTTYYDKEKQTLKVIFRSGAVYVYFDVPEEVYQQFMKARSKGTFLNLSIKGSYEFERVD